MSAPKHSVKISILTDEFTIRSDTPPDQTREIAGYLDTAARQVMAGGNVVESNRAVVLAALRITAELFAEREERRALAQSITTLNRDLRELVEADKR